MTTGPTLRPVTDADLDFLRAVYASTRAAELAMVDWTREQRDRFVEMQFRAQHAHYTEHFADARFDVVESDGVAIGRLYVLRDEAEFRIIDIALLPEYRGHGIGGELLARVLDEADRAGVPVSLHVEQENPARRLYDRLDFQRVDDNGVYVQMRRPPERSGATPEER